MAARSPRASIICMARSSMRPESTRIDRRLTVTSPANRLPAAGAVVVFHDEWGAIAQAFDLDQLGLSRELTILFADALRMHYAGATPETRKGCWKALRAFARFIADDGNVAATGDIGTETIGRYIVWLDKQCSDAGRPWTTATRHGRYIHIKMLLLWTVRNRPGLLPARLTFPRAPFRGRHRHPEPQRLSAPHLKTILRACYEEIDAAWMRFEEGRAILARAQGGLPADQQSEFEAFLHDVYRLGGGIMLRYRKGDLPPELKRRFDRFGGARSVAPYLHLTVDTLTPFFLAIAIQTAANPDALRMIGRDCIASHPLDEHRATVDWAKPRAGGNIRRAQRRSFDRRRPYAAPNLIDRILAMTAPLVAHAFPGARDRLFLIHGYRPKGVTVISAQTLAAGTHRFVARANQRIAAWNDAHPDQPRSPLPSFAPVSLRGSVATEHYHAAGGDILAAQTVLNHARADTTDLYIRGPRTRQLQQETITRLQRTMIAWITGTPPPTEATTDKAGAEDAPHAKQAETFSHICVDPLAGAAPGAVRGRLCPSFDACLTCPGLVVPVDAEHLARVLRAKRKLEAARERIDPARWTLLYAPGYRVLVEDILPDFPAALHADAERLIAQLSPLPDLE